MEFSKRTNDYRKGAAGGALLPLTSVMTTSIIMQSASATKLNCSHKFGFVHGNGSGIRVHFVPKHHDEEARRALVPRDLYWTKFAR